SGRDACWATTLRRRGAMPPTLLHIARPCSSVSTHQPKRHKDSAHTAVFCSRGMSSARVYSVLRICIGRAGPLLEAREPDQILSNRVDQNVAQPREGFP